MSDIPGLRPPRRGPTAQVSTAAATSSNHVRFEPPCVYCRCPMLPGEKACPRCKKPREMAA